MESKKYFLITFTIKEERAEQKEQFITLIERLGFEKTQDQSTYFKKEPILN